MEEQGLGGCNVSGSDPGFLLNFCFALWICETSWSFFLCAHTSFLLKLFTQLKKHVVLESLMPALFFCHQKGSRFLMVNLKSLKRGELLPFEAIFFLSSEKRHFSFPLQVWEYQITSTEHFSESHVAFLKGFSPKSWQILPCLALEAAT